MNDSTSVGASTLTFQNTKFEVVDLSGQVWLRSLQIEGALGYRSNGRAISQLYQRNADEFRSDMTQVLALDTPGGLQEVRVFSLRGAHLLGMLARTQVAKEFRSSVLDVLESQPLRQPEQLTLAQEMALIRLSVSLMEKVARCDNLARAEELFMRLLRVNRALGMDTLPFVDLAFGGWRQTRLPLDDGTDLEATPH